MSKKNIKKKNIKKHLKRDAFSIYKEYYSSSIPLIFPALSSIIFLANPSGTLS